MDRVSTLARTLRLSKSRRPCTLLLGTRGSFEAVRLQTLDADLGAMVQGVLAGRFDEFYERMDALGSEASQLYLGEIFGHAALLPAWRQLAQMLREGFFSMVLTVCYDSLLEQALAQQGLIPMRDYTVFTVGVSRDEEIRRFLRTPSVLKIIKLHGDLGLGSVRLTPEETLRFPQAVATELVDVTREMLVVVGYEERHRDVLEVMNRASDASVWWASWSGLSWERSEDRSVLRLMLDRKSDQNVVSGPEGGFAEFVSALHAQLGRSLPDDQRPEDELPPKPPEDELRRRLRQVLVERFNESELRTLCFELDVDYESLQGQGKADKARELVAYLGRRQRIQGLALTVKRLRPDIDI